jgi:thioredoxin-related protein
MTKSIRFLFILASVLFIAFLHLYAPRISLAQDKAQKKNPAPTPKADSLIWYKYDDGLAKAKKEKKHVLISFYTKWCGWCRKMDQYTFTDKEIKKVLNESYVAVKVDAQSSNKVKSGDKTITEKQVAGDFRTRSYPTTWFLKDSGDKIAPYYGYASAQDFLQVLNYVKDDLYDKISFQEYIKNQTEKKDEEKK